jgi:phage regulator Rha-like protein
MTKDTESPLPAVTGDDRPRVFELRGVHVMLASDVAEVFGVETRQIVQNIKNNIEKFSERYAFEITEDEQAGLRSLGVIPKPGRGGSRALPWVVTQKGTMRLATIMDAPKAIEATDIFIDVFTEVLTQVYQGKSEIEVSNPSRIAPDEETIRQVQSVRKQIAKAVTNLLNTVVDTKRRTTVNEPRRVCRRLRTLRRWSHDEDLSTIFSGSARACRAHGSGSPGGSRLAVGCDLLDSVEIRVQRRDAAQVGAAGGARQRPARRANERAA